MTTIAPSESEVKDFVSRWFKALDRHDSLEDVLPMLADEPLVMKFPEGTQRGHAGFTEWYDTVTKKFFDESHELRSLAVGSPQGDGVTEVHLVVNWKASIWNPPAPDSERIDFDATQTWTVGKSDDGDPVVLSYVVEDLKQLPGSASI